MVRIVTIADTHDHHDAIVVPDGDILVHAGDLTMLGGKKEIKKCFEWINALPHKYKIVVAGNHDLNLSPDTPMYHDLNMKQLVQSYPAITYLCDTATIIKIKDRVLKIWGSPYTVEFNDWVFQYPAGERSWDNIPEDVDIVVTHMPPYGILDTIENDRGDFSGGCKQLRDRILTIVKPRLHIFGHLHCDGGREVMVNDTTFVNAAIGYKDEWYPGETPEAMCINI